MTGYEYQEFKRLICSVFPKSYIEVDYVTIVHDGIMYKHQLRTLRAVLSQSYKKDRKDILISFAKRMTNSCCSAIIEKNNG